MRNSALGRLGLVVLLSLVTASCQTTPATDGSGYQLTRFSNPAAARLAAEDATAGAAINSNNLQCRRDPACKK